MMNVKIVLKNDVKKEELENSNFITGFRTLGEVGYVTTRYIVLKRKMEKIGFILTPSMRDVTFLDEYGLATPFDLFLDRELKILVLVNHLLPIRKEWPIFTKKITQWLKQLNTKNEILIGGLDKAYKANNNDTLRWLKNSYSNIELRHPLIEKQLLMVGPLALLTIYGEAERLPVTVLLPYADRDRIDPEAAAVAVETLNELLQVNVDTHELYEDAKRINEELQRQMELLQKELNKGSSQRVYM